MEKNPDLIIKGVIKHGQRDITCGNCGIWEYLYSVKMYFVAQEARAKGQVPPATQEPPGEWGGLFSGVGDCLTFFT